VIEPAYGREGLTFADLEPGRIAEEAMTLDTTRHYSRPGCLRLGRAPGGSRRGG